MSEMGNIKVILPDDLEKEFREEIFKSKGMKRGNITEAIEEAVSMWIEAERKRRSEISKKAWETRRRRGKVVQRIDEENEGSKETVEEVKG